MSLARLLWLCAGLLASVVAAELAWPEAEIAAAPPARPSGPPTPRAARPADQTARWIATLLERPPFSPERRPPASGPAAAAPSAEPPRLAGILMTSDGRSALFATDGGRAVVAREGGRVGRFEVRTIKPGEVVLEGPDGVRTLHPRYAQSDAAPEPPPAGVPVFRPQVGRADAALAAAGLLPRAPGADTRPFNQMTSPSGAAIFSNAPNVAGVRK